MSFLRPKITTIHDVQSHVWVHPLDREASTRSSNPYISRLAPRGRSMFFELDRTLSLDQKRVRGELVGAVVFSGRDHSLADHRSIVVALPLRGTHDNRGYVAAQITAEQMTAETDKHTTAIKLAEVAAAIAVHGYLQASIVTQSLQVSEATTHMLNRLWQVR